MARLFSPVSTVAKRVHFKQIVVCAARKPVRVSKDGDAWTYRPSRSAFKSSVDFLATANTVVWVCWPGGVEASSQAAVRRRLELEHNAHAVFPSFDV